MDYICGINQKSFKMSKKLLLIAATLVTVGLSAQNKTQKNSLKQASFGYATNLKAANTLTQTCDSIVTMNLQTATVSVASAGTDSTVPTCTAIAGYVYGTNCYADKEKAQFFDGATYYGSIPNLSITAVKVMFWHDVTSGEGTQGGGGASVGIRFYTGNVPSGPTGAPFGNTSFPMSNVLASSTGNFFFYQFNCVVPVAVPAAGFFASVLLPTQNVGDTAVIASQVSPTANVVWEKFSDNSWHAVTETPASWGAPGNMLIIPKYCFYITTGLSQNLGISENVWVYPNPSTGTIKISTSFMSEEKIEITVTNALGQIVANTKKNASIDLLSLDISDKPNGVYFVTVSSATDKMVTRLIINK